MFRFLDIDFISPLNLFGNCSGIVSYSIILATIITAFRLICYYVKSFITSPKKTNSGFIFHVKVCFFVLLRLITNFIIGMICGDRCRK